MAGKQREYTAEFTREAVTLRETRGTSGGQIARELGIADSALSHGKRQLTEHGAQAFPGKGHQTEPEAAVHRVRQENARRKQARDSRKKAIAIFTQAPR